MLDLLPVRISSTKNLINIDNMKQNHFTLSFVTGLVMLVSLASCSSHENDSPDNVMYMMPEAKTMQLTVQQKALVADNNDFSFNLFRTINSQAKAPESRIVSPISVTYLLGMLNDAATGETQAEITNTLGFSGKTAKEINELCQTMMTQAPMLDKQVTIETANAIYTNKGYSLNKQFAQDMADYYKASAKSLDFSTTKALNEINDWAKSQTHGMIPQLLDKLSPRAVAYLLNAVYFQAKWTRQFDAKDTQKEEFTTEDGRKTKVAMMHNKARAVCTANDTYSTLCLPYGSGTVWNMMVLLPHEGKTVDDVIASLSSEKWRENIRQMTAKELDIKMPKFNTDTTTDLIEILKQMGIKSAFDSKHAQMPNLCDNINVYISNIMQKARIEVSEEGTKATAVTVAELTNTSVGPDPIDIEKGEFHANRPFVYLITENNSDAIFFIGVYQGE